MDRLKARLPRRGALTFLGKLGVAGFFVPAWNEIVEAQGTITCVPATPTVTEGPYWVDEKLFRADIRTDPETGVAREGVPLTLTINVQNLSGSTCTPLVGAYVDIWQCDAKGIYSDEPTYNPGGGTGPVNTTGQKFLRGYLITNEQGQVRFTTIYPGWYTGRTIHIHFRVRTYSGETVLGNFVSQIFFPEEINDAVLALPAYSRTTGRNTINANDMIFRVANADRMLAAITAGPGAGYSASLTVGVTLRTEEAARPTIATGGVGNAVSGAPGVSPGSWIAIYGTNLTPATRAAASSDLVDGVLPTSLSGVSVQINGKAAFLQYVSPTQVNVLAPADTASGQVSITVTNATGTSNMVTTVMFPVLPGLSVLANYVRAVRYPDGAIINGTGSVEAGYTTSAAVGQGDIIALFGTGFGPVEEGAPETGTVFGGAYATTNDVDVRIGSVDAEVLWSGIVGAGLYQANVRVPAALADGDHAVIATVGGAASQTGALLKVAASVKLPAAMAPTASRTKAGRWIEEAIAIERIAILAGLTPQLGGPRAAATTCGGGAMIQLA